MGDHRHRGSGVYQQTLFFCIEIRSQPRRMEDTSDRDAGEVHRSEERQRLELSDEEKDSHAHNIISQDNCDGEEHKLVRMNVVFANSAG